MKNESEEESEEGSEEEEDRLKTARRDGGGEDEDGEEECRMRTHRDEEVRKRHHVGDRARDRDRSAPGGVMRVLLLRVLRLTHVDVDMDADMTVIMNPTSDGKGNSRDILD